MRVDVVLRATRAALRRMPALARRVTGGGVAGLALLTAGCATLRPTSPSAAQIAGAAEPPAAPREFRAVWVATVANIDWPSKPALPSAQQRAEMLAILDCAQALHLNAIILQVRPAADALYASSVEPWSEYLTGRQGQAPKPYYDPLRVWIEEAHRRGLQLHAWLNPYRARHSSAKSPLARDHIARAHPEAVKTYGDLLWMDPGEPAAVRQTLAVVRDLVTRYDVDGVHLDDYFYPYPIKAAGDFPDDASWRRYLEGGGRLSRADWRRQNVDTLIERIGPTIHALKPDVSFGVSPFGIGRPDRRPPGIAGFSQFDGLYADVERWLQAGWIDYLAPQLYWPIEQKPQAFGTLLDYWAQQNTAGRHVWPGLFTSGINATAKSWQPEQVARQIELIRTDEAIRRDAGHIQYSMIALMHDRRGIATTLRQGVYAEPALVPRSPWLGTTAPHAPRLSRDSRASRAVVRIHPSWFGRRPATFAVWRHVGGAWRFSVQSAHEHVVDPVTSQGIADRVVVSAVDRLGNESARVFLDLNEPSA